MPVTLTPDQRKGCDMLTAEIIEGGHMTWHAPIACGKTMILCHALQAIKGDILVVSRHRKLAEQFVTIAERCEIPLTGIAVHCVHRHDTLTPPDGYELIVRYIGANDIDVNHPNVLTVL